MTLLQRIRTSSARWFVLPTLLSLVVLTATSACDTQSTTAGTEDYTGQQLFRGLFFAQGEASRHYSNIWNTDNASQYIDSESEREVFEKFRTADSLRSKAADRYVAWISQEEPEFFDRFDRAIQSGNQLEVKRGLRNAGDLMANAAQDMTEGELVLTGDSQQVFDALGPDTQAMAIPAVAAETVVIAVFAVAVFTVLTQVDATPKQGDGASSLEYEQAVDYIAKNLATV